MTRKTTWDNDSLIKGFGPNYPERMVGGVHKKVGVVEEARLHVTWESTFGEGTTGAYIQLPRMAIVHESYFVVDVAWASTDSGTLSVGHDEAGTADVDAFLTATALAAAALTPAGKAIAPDGAYFKDTNSLLLPAVITDSADDATVGAQVFFTLANTFTAGEGTLVVRYTVAK